MSDPKKRQHYDKYGTVDEDNFNFEEFMKGFSFDNIFEMFDDDFGNKVLIVFILDAANDGRRIIRWKTQYETHVYKEKSL